MIFKKYHQTNYTCICNSLIRDVRISNKSLGLMVKMLSLPDNWDFSIAGLAAICKDQETAVSSSLDELKQYGYVKIEPLREGGRIVDWIYNIYETPHLVTTQHENVGKVDSPDNEKEKAKKEELAAKKKVDQEEEEQFINSAIEYLNTKVGTRFTNCASNSKLIKKLRKSGYTLEDLNLVVDSKCNEWLLDKQMRQYLRPITLFGDKFESYLSYAEIKKQEYEKKEIHKGKVYD